MLEEQLTDDLFHCKRAKIPENNNSSKSITIRNLIQAKVRVCKKLGCLKMDHGFVNLRLGQCVANQHRALRAKVYANLAQKLLTGSTV